MEPMKHLTPGISVLEVVIAVLILAAAGTALMGLQGTLLRGVSSAHGIIERLGFIRSFFVVGQKDRLFKRAEQTKELEDPPLQMTYQVKKTVSPALSKQAYLMNYEIEAEWQGPFGTKRDSYTRLQFNPKERV